MMHMLRTKAGGYGWGAERASVWRSVFIMLRIPSARVVGGAKLAHLG